ncbi:RagB/SusD family nutrient uptake outer membrane protein [Ochrovirga pacifica]|uniref:RagB/SusD family nutrient uptake outer membrane protein n=1 Tax=Ochrovirga pacifica TaxID=1042376 RepID=UPI00025594FE|nr:RagB/SusD family nutrient uptake outer membrane protein [Ochrovirga pacifica]
MKKNKFYIGLLTVVSVFSLGSCSEDFLDVENPNQVESSLYVENNDDLETVLNAAYSSYTKSDGIATQMEYERSDMVYPGGIRPYTPGNEPFYTQTFNNSNRSIADKWAVLYEGVFRANQVMAEYDKIKGTYATEIDSLNGALMYAQARALRGYFYFNISNSFNEGEVPIFDEPSENPEDTRKDNASKQEVLNFYRADLAYGMQHLPLTWRSGQVLNRGGAVTGTTGNPSDIVINGTGELGRISAGACEALLGKSYLYQYDFKNPDMSLITQAKKHFERLLPDVGEDGGYGYQLTDHVGDNFTSQNEYNSESILEVNYSVDLAQDRSGEEALHNDLSLKLGAGLYNPAMSPASWLVIQYKRDSIDIKRSMNQLGANPDYDNTLPEDKYKNPSLDYRKYSHRMSHSIAYIDDDDTKFYDGDITELVTHPRALKQQANCFMWKKLTNWDITSSETGLTTDGRSGVNMRLIRLADIYLMYAECLLEEGNIAEARRNINKIRYRSGVVLLGPSIGSEEFSNATFTTDNGAIALDINGNGVEGGLAKDANGNYTDIYEEISYDSYEVLRYHLRHVERPLELAIEGNALRTIDLRRWGITKQRFIEIADREYAIGGYIALNPADPTKTVNRWSIQIFPLYEPTINASLGGFQDIYHVYDEKYESQSPADPATENDNVLNLNATTVKLAGAAVSRKDENLASRRLTATYFKDCVEASQNYDESKAYLPIPITELNANSK